jgi:hypothetical protein
VQRAQVAHQLPPLEFWQSAERRHASVGISIREFPEKGAIALGLNFRQQKIRRIFLGEPSATLSVALDAISFE